MSITFRQQGKVAKRLGSELCEAASSGDLEDIQEVHIAPSRRARLLTAAARATASRPRRTAGAGGGASAGGAGVGNGGGWW